MSKKMALIIGWSGLGLFVLLIIAFVGLALTMNDVSNDRDRIQKEYTELQKAHKDLQADYNELVVDKTFESVDKAKELVDSVDLEEVNDLVENIDKMQNELEVQE